MTSRIRLHPSTARLRSRGSTRGSSTRSQDLHLESVRRLNSPDATFVVDESILTGHVQGSWAGVDGGGAPVRIRMLHLFNLRDGLIERENTWFDSAAVSRQIEVWKTSHGQGS